ncbi:MAG: hypothetical protein IJN16_02770 [Lachnospiraceae bacterium]|nr:hypothetical protein [Lachnospiraceae bacterium]
MKFVKTVFLVLVCVLSLVGCGYQYQEMEGDQITDYLSERYGGTFEIISTEEKARYDREYLDADMEKLNIKGDDTREDMDYIYTIKDENGVEFNLVGFKQYGWGSYYQYTDDYNVQVLKANPVLWEKLEGIGFPYTYYNGIGYDDLPKAYFDVQISCFEDVEAAVTDICEMVACEELEIPLAPYSNEELATKSIVPRVRLLSQDACVWNIDFRYVGQEDAETVETYIQNAERQYVYCVREGRIEETLTEDILLTYGPEKIKDVYYQEEDVPISLYYGFGHSLGANGDCYIIWDNPKKLEEKGAYIYYDDLNILLETVGYRTAYTENAVIWTKGSNVVTIEVEENSYICRRNGVVYKPEGIVNTALIKLTEKDMQELFGNTYEIDKIGEQAQIMINIS